MDGSGKRVHFSGPEAAHNDAALALRPARGTPATVGAEAIPSHFEPRRWSLRSDAARPFIHLLCLSAGQASARFAAEEMQTWSGPSLVWLPAGSAEHLDIAAGAAGHLLRLRSGLWHRHLPSSAEPAYLDLAGTEAVLAFAVSAELATVMARSVAAIAAELDNPARRGAVSILSAELTLCVLRFWRLFADESAGEAQGSSAEILSRFRRLVEERFHQQLRVAEYAALLGVTPDRLHALCTRALKRSPSALIQQRIVQEAATRLETTTATIKQIAFALGFKDSAYFNRFFVKHTGQAPGVWRKGVSSQRTAGQARAALDFADWP
jgi:AraC family transcriptional activator of pobA